MYITHVLSHHGAWGMIEKSESDELDNLINQINLSDLSIISASNIRNKITNKFKENGWTERVPQYFSKERISRVDFVKGRLGVELSFGKFFYTESVIFVKFPIFIKSKSFDIGLIILPTKEFTKQMELKVGTFEMVKDRLTQLQPLPVKFPFALLGVSGNFDPLKVTELTTDLDIYLTNHSGYSFLEMQMLGEKPSYEFKRQLPNDNLSFAHEICAFANNANGGLILIGVDDNGYPTGINQKELDDLQLRISNIAQSNCHPAPEIEQSAFTTPNNYNTYILVVRVNELRRKPCMVREKVYIRSGTSAIPATSEDIRRVLLGQNN
jgi:hypothetical protein